jgi:formamidopyrimidine-DNA glycosylase
VPELVEVERYRQAAEGLIGRPLAAVEVPDPHCLAPPTTIEGLRSALVGWPVVAARRRGKLLVLDIGPARLGIHFSMTGTLVVDGRSAIDRLLYAPAHHHRWVRAEVHMADGGTVLLHDPRRLARIRLDPDEDALGPDALGISLAQLRAALSAGRAGGPPLKARLLDQSKVAGLGNLLVDEILWRASLAPVRLSGRLASDELRRLHRAIGATLRQLAARGGSHTGDLMAERRPGGRCRRDGTPLVRQVVGGRTTWWCPQHQV